MLCRNPKGFAAARLALQGSQPRALGTHSGVWEQTGTNVVVPLLLFPCRAGRGQRGWAGSWVTATARRCSGAGTITRIPGRASLPTPQGFSWDPASIWGWQRGHYLLQLGLSSFPSSFGSEATFSFVSIFFPLAAARFVPRGLLFGECFCQKCVFLSLEAESCKKKTDFNEQTLPIHHLEVLAVHVNQNLLKVGHIVKMN